jgi:hypothetical protein
MACARYDSTAYASRRVLHGVCCPALRQQGPTTGADPFKHGGTRYAQRRSSAAQQAQHDANGDEVREHEDGEHGPHHVAQHVGNQATGILAEAADHGRGGLRRAGREMRFARACCVSRNETRRLRPVDWSQVESGGYDICVNESGSSQTPSGRRLAAARARRPGGRWRWRPGTRPRARGRGLRRAGARRPAARSH